MHLKEIYEKKERLLEGAFGDHVYNPIATLQCGIISSLLDSLKPLVHPVQFPEVHHVPPLEEFGGHLPSCFPVLHGALYDLLLFVSLLCWVDESECVEA